MTIETPFAVLVLPEFDQAGKNGLCAAYDEDCLEPGYPYYRCWKSWECVDEGLCPFLD